MTSPAEATRPEHVLLRAEGLVKTYGHKTVVKGVSFEVRQGEIVGLLGPNGAGKTTSFYMVMGLVRPTQGRIVFDGQDITYMPMFKRGRLGMGYLAQEASIFRKLTVEENILAILETLDISKKERDRRLEMHLEELGLTRLAQEKAMTLSGGERRRLEITRSLVTNPSLLLLDEPFAGVDPIAVHDVQQIILQLKKRGLSILITDHNVQEVLFCVDHAYLMYQGESMCDGNQDYLIHDQKARDLYLGPKFNPENVQSAE